MAENSTRRSTLVWAAILTLCLVATIYEIPNIVTSVRQHAQLFIKPEDHLEFFVTERLAAEDLESSDILRYGIKWRYASHDRSELKALVAKYPDNEFLLASLSEAAVLRDHSRYAEVRATIDHLAALDPDNAYYHYLRGWALLRTSGGTRRLPEASHAFAQGHETPKFRAPYQKYKAQVDLLAEKAGLSDRDRPWVRPFYTSLGNVVGNAAHWEGLDPESFRALIDSATRLADRAMENAYDVDSLAAAATLMRDIEQTRLRDLDLSQAEAWQARLRLSQALALDDFRWFWNDDNWLTDSSSLIAMPWLMLLVILLGLLATRIRRGKRVIIPKTGGAFGMGLVALIFVGVFLVFYRRYPAGFWMYTAMDASWLLIMLVWFDWARDLAEEHTTDTPPIGRFAVAVTLGPFAFIGILLLLIGNTTFLWSRGFGEWSEHLAIFGVWLIFCLLLRQVMLDPQPVFGQVRHTTGVTMVICWVGLLLAFDLAGAQWHYGSRAYADPLSVCGPLPTATRETYERIIPDGGLLRYVHDDPTALPEYVYYLTGEDMEALLEKRRAENKPLTEEQLQDLLEKSARDIRPVIQAAIDERETSL